MTTEQVMIYKAQAELLKIREQRDAALSEGKSAALVLDLDGQLYGAELVVQTLKSFLAS